MASSSVWTPEEEFLRFAQTANLSSREDLRAIKAVWDNAFASQVDKIAALKRLQDDVDNSLTINSFGSTKGLGVPRGLE